jgi:hypothetical protein
MDAQDEQDFCCVYGALELCLMLYLLRWPASGYAAVPKCSAMKGHIC